MGTKALTPAQVNDILFSAEIHSGGKFIGYARKLEITLDGQAPISLQEAKDLMEKISASFRNLGSTNG